MADIQRAFSSPRAILQIDNKRIGWAQGISVRPGVTTAPIKVLGNIYTVRFEPTDTNCSGSFDYIHILAAPLRSLAQGNGATALWAGHFLSTAEWIRYEPPAMTLVDTITNKSILTIEGMVPEGQSFSLSQGGLLMVSCNFVCTRAFEHKEPIST